MTVPESRAPLPEQVPPRPQEGTRRTHFAELEAYRGIAALLVVLFHAYQYTREGIKGDRYLYEGTPAHLLFVNLDTPVAWFFALSGFLMFLPMAQGIMQGQGVERGRWFLFRRAIRILPLYVLAITVVWALRYGSQPGAWTDLIEHLTFTHIWDSRYLFYTIGPAWSLGNEVVFYVMLAIMGGVLVRVTRQTNQRDRQRWLLGFPFGLVVLSGVYKLVMHLGFGLQPSNLAWFFNPLAHADTFGMGMLLAALYASGWRLSYSTVRALLLLGAGLTLALIFMGRFEEPLVRLFAFTLSGFAFTLILSFTVLSGRPSRLAQRSNRPFWTTLGMLSYGIYLWHEPLMLELSRRSILISAAPEAFWFNSIVLACLTSAVAYVTYQVVERPMLELRHLFTRDGHFRDGYAEAKAQYAREVIREKSASKQWDEGSG